MFGFRKNAIQVKGVEKFFEKENKQREKSRKKAARRGIGKMRWIGIILAVLVIAGLAVFAGNQQTQLARVRASKDREISDLRLRISTLSTKLEESDKQVQTLKESIVALERQVEAERSQRARAEAETRSRPAGKRKL